MCNLRRSGCQGLLAALLLSLASCGAGWITGVVSSDRKSRPPEARVPELSVSPVLPLVSSAGSVRTVVVANAQIATVARLRVRIEALGIGIDQREPVASGQGGTTLISFGLDTTAIMAVVADPTADDIDASLSVLVDEVLVAAPVPVVLARQPRAELVLDPGQTERFLSPLGERVSVRVEGMRSGDAEGLQLLVTTMDPSQPVVGGMPGTVTRVCTDLRLEAPLGDVEVVSAFVPGSTLPTRAQLFVNDAVAGQSTTVENAYYRPEIALALPSQGPTTGGTPLTLIGTALLPYDFAAGNTPTPFAFGDVELSFEKGQRTTRLLPQDFHTSASGSDHLAFTMPPSPDGRPGQVDIILRVTLGAVQAKVTARLFLYANPDPFFGPRGTVLDRLPVAVAPIALESAPNLDGPVAPDFVALTDPGGVAFLQLLLAQDNGMFQRFAVPRQIGNPEVLAERMPRDLCVGDFDGDQVPDVFIVNEGAAMAVHQLVLGQSVPDPPLGTVHRFVADPGMAHCRSANFDGDMLPDVLLVPGANAPAGLQPQVWLSRPQAQGQPGFAAPIPLSLRSFPYEAFEVADLDGDGNLDVAVASGTTLQMDVAYGHGDGTFEPGVPINLQIPGYEPSPGSIAVGLHACADGVEQSLGLVLAGVASTFPPTGMTKPTVVLLQQAGRAFAQPAVAQVFSVPTEPIGRSLAADIDENGSIDLVLAMANEPSFITLVWLQLDGNGFRPVPGGGIEFGAESPRQIRALNFDLAFPANPPLSGEAKAVFIVHESEIDGVRERRLSTRLIAGSAALPRLVPPDAGDNVAPIDNLVGGNFHAVSIAGHGAVRDLALAQHQPDRIELVQNDGFGGFPSLTDSMLFPGLLPHSLTLLPAPEDQVDRLLFCGSDARLGVWQHSLCTMPPCTPMVQAPNAVTIDLRSLIQDPLLANALLGDGTRLRVGDVDGDGVPDLVVLLSFALSNRGESDARLGLLRGKATFADDEFPFVVPTILTPVHGNASSIALGDFAAGLHPPRQLELAVAVPEGTTSGAADGDHVRFFRYVAGATPADDHFEPSAMPGGPNVLLVGSAPTLLTAGDFDRDGLVDLLAACAGDSRLWLFRNTAALQGVPGQVDVAAFHESQTGPRQLDHGLPTTLKLSDVNGDGSLDAVVFVEFAGQAGLSTSIAYYLSVGGGLFEGPTYTSRTRTGDRNGHLSGDLGDWNRDQVPDLFLGWDLENNRNLRVLFGGTR